MLLVVPGVFFRFFEVLSADGEKVAELQVSVVLESLMGMFSKLSICILTLLLNFVKI